jgi:hypothetical protein
MAMRQCNGGIGIGLEDSVLGLGEVSVTNDGWDGWDEELRGWKKTLDSVVPTIML